MRKLWSDTIWEATCAAWVHITEKPKGESCKIIISCQFGADFYCEACGLISASSFYGTTPEEKTLVAYLKNVVIRQEIADRINRCRCLSKEDLREELGIAPRRTPRFERIRVGALAHPPVVNKAPKSVGKGPKSVNKVPKPGLANRIRMGRSLMLKS